MNLTQNHDETEEISSTPISVILSRQNQRNPHIAVAACIPRKRDGLEDPVRATLMHFAFFDDSRNFTNLNALLTRLGNVQMAYVACTDIIDPPPKCTNVKIIRKAKENKAQLQKLIDSLPPCVSSIHDLPKSLSSNPSSELDIYMNHLLGNDTKQHLAYRGNRSLNECSLSKMALCLLIQEMNLSTLGEEGTYEVQSGTLSSHLNLDGIAAECINLLPPKNSGMASLVGGNSSNNSIYGVLNKTRTKMGAKLLENWLRQPLVDKKKIDKRHDVVELLVTNSTSRDKLMNIGLKNVCNLDRLCAKLSEGKGGSSACLEQLYHAFLFADQQLPIVIEIMEQIIENSTKDEMNMLNDFMNGLKDAYLSLGNLKELVKAVLDFDLAPQTFLVRSDFDERLIELKEELDKIEQELKQIHEDMDYEWSEISGQPSGQIRLENVSTDSDNCCWQFRLPKTNDEKILRSELSNRVNVHRLLKNGVYFSTKELRELGTQKQDVVMEYTSKQKGIVQNAMDVAMTFIPVLEKSSSILSQIDVLASFASVASYSPQIYCRPEMTDGDDPSCGIILDKARHPCVELQDGIEFIPNNFDLKFESSSFLLLTGPNMGGKSTFIRSLGAIVTMAQIGSFVPAASAKINIVDKILARVGAGDAQQKGISTFMAEMLEASSIIQRATKRSLIVIDELGRGTSTFDGFGLAWAISEYIVKNIGAITLFATHFHELTRLEETMATVKNFHVTADGSKEDNVLTFLYEVMPGPCMESFGIKVAEMANVPPSVVNEAKRKAKDLENFNSKKKKMNTMKSDIDEATVFAKAFKNIPLKSLASREEKFEALQQLFYAK